MGFIQPTGTLLKANSPLHFGYSLVSGQFETVEFEIFVWSGAAGARPSDPVYTIARQSGFVNSQPYHVDLSPIVKGYLSTLPIDFDTTAAVQNSPTDSAMWLQVRHTVTSTNALENVNAVLSDVFLINRSYSLFTDGANKATDEVLLIPNRELLLDEYTPAFLPINIADIGAGAITINYIADGATRESLVLGGLTSNTQKIQYVAAGFCNVQNYFQGQGSSFDLTAVNYFEIEVIGTDGIRASLTKVYKEQRGKYTPYALAYINRYGVWDTIVFHKASTEDFGASSTQYTGYIGSMSATGFSYGQHEASNRSFNASSRSKWTLNTGYVTEATGEAMRDLVMSESVLMLDNFSEVTTGTGTSTEYLISMNTTPVIVDSKSFRVMKHVNDKLVNYTVGVTSANNWNNTII